MAEGASRECAHPRAYQSIGVEQNENMSDKKTEYRFYEVVEQEDMDKDKLIAVLKCDFLTDGDVWNINAILEERLGRPVIWY